MRLLNVPALLSLVLLTGCATGMSTSNLEPYGVWQGTLPCADCPGIETRLALYKDPYSYRLEETYLDGNGEPVIHEGEWVLLPPMDNMDLGRVSLKGEGEKPLRRFQRLPGGNLEMMGQDGEQIRSELNYTLERKRVSE